MNARQFREFIVRPVLQATSMHSENAENLLMGTAAQESHFEYIKQLGAGPALGLFQMEPDTHDDIWANYLRYRAEVQESIMIACGIGGEQCISGRLLWDLRYATLMCRVHYRRVTAALPSDIDGMAHYWKDHYNTELGAGTVDEFKQNYGKFVGIGE